MIASAAVPPLGPIADFALQTCVRVSEPTRCDQLSRLTSMLLTLVTAAWLLHGVQCVLGLVVQPAPLQYLTRADDLGQAAANLAQQLSENASVIFPSDAEWDGLLIRGSSPRVSPNYTVVVEVATEGDVQTTVELANRYGIPFLAVSGTHGWTETLNKLPFGFQINMRKLNSTTLDDGGKTATVGGGTLQYEITRSLFDEGKQTGIALSTASLEGRQVLMKSSYWIGRMRLRHWATHGGWSQPASRSTRFLARQHCIRSNCSSQRHARSSIQDRES